MSSTNTFSGRGNRGFQQGSNSGHVHNHFNIPVQPEGPPDKPNPCSTVPFQRDPDFVHRDILAEIDEKCSKTASHSRAALVGLGGVGKSQLAIEYSYRIMEQFPQTWIFWVHASNAARFEEGYRTIADTIMLPRRDEPKADILKLVSNWLRDEANGRWIMILDNADDHTVLLDPRKGGLKSDSGDLIGGPVLLSSFIPQTPNGTILVTSRSEDAAFRLTGSHNNIIKVEPMDEDPALLLFRKKLRGGFDNESDATELLRALDYMPLAISQAAAYISQRAPRITVARYLNDFRKSDRNRADLLNIDAGDLRRDSKASNSIIATWQISFEYIRSKRPSAARLLSLMSLFDRQGIPEFLLHSHDDREDDIDMEFEEDVVTLTNYSLIMTNVKDNQFEMHRLVQLSTKKWLELNNELEKWTKIYIRIMSNAFPNGGYKSWSTCQVLFPHAQVVVAYRPAEKKYLVYWSGILNNAGLYALAKGDYLIAEEIIRRALEGSEKALGEEHLDTLTSVHNLALALRYQGRYEAAEEMSRRALEGREKVLGGEHTDTLKSVGMLAEVLRNQGEHEAAEEMYRRALEGLEKALGEEHPDTLTSVDILGMTLLEQGNYKAAEEMNRRALEGREKVLGEEHPDTLKSVGNLAGVLQNQRKHEAAEEMIRRVVEGLEKTLGEGHPDTLTSVGNLGVALQEQGKYEAAEEMYRRALEGREKVLGGEHPDTLMSVYCLACLRHQQRRYTDATALYERSYAGFQKVLGVNHPDTLRCSRDYASMIKEMNASRDFGVQRNTYRDVGTQTGSVVTLPRDVLDSG